LAQVFFLKSSREILDALMVLRLRPNLDRAQTQLAQLRTVGGYAAG
jgi:hypothetical protein